MSQAGVIKVADRAPQSQSVPYRVYGNPEIDEFLKRDKLSKSLAKKVRDRLMSLSRTFKPTNITK